jgi:Putative auto-transporter adhesin, head GIN domain
MKYSYQYEDVQVISEKPIVEANFHFVRFSDGSQANLETLEIINRGKGNIYFKFDNNRTVPFNSSVEKYSIGIIEHINVISNSELDLVISPTDSEESYIEVVGTNEFISSVSVRAEGNYLYIERHGYDDDNIIFVNNGHTYINGRRVKKEPEYIPGRIIVKLKNELLGSLTINSKRQGNVEVLTNIKYLNVEVNGAQALNFKSVYSSKIVINGSASIDIEHVSHLCNIMINGSGSINIESGEVQTLDVALNGSGNVNANVSAKNANLILQGSGNITVSHVFEESFEVHRGSGKINVIKRGIDEANH